MITDYSTLVTAVGNWLARDDLAAYIPDFIAFGENRIYGKLRIRAMETALNGTVSSGVVSVPSDYIELKHAYINQDPSVILSRTKPESIYTHYPTRSASGLPTLISREGDSFIFGPYPDSNYNVRGIYYARLTALSESNTTNWFTGNASDLLLYAALVEAANFMEDDENFIKYENLFNRAVDRVMQQDNDEQFSGSTLRTIPR